MIAHVPIDGTPRTEVVGVSIPVAVALILVQVCCLLFAIVCLLFNFINRNKKYSLQLLCLINT